jgi:hypothetical protein
MYQLLAGSCGGGPCPTLYLDDVTGAVAVQGYETDAPFPLPQGEGLVRIPADAWARLLSGLPARMLLRALMRRDRLTPARTPLMQDR